MSAEQKQEAVVKPLEWVWFAESSTGYERYEAHTLAGEWWVSVQPDCVELNFPKSLKTEKFCTLEAAKAAAQADYEARIRSALAPAASSQERIAQLEGALSGLLAIDESTEPLAIQAAWLHARAALPAAPERIVGAAK